MKKDQKLLGARIQYLRKRRHLTQEKLAEKMNISVNYLSSVERGIGNPTLNLFFKLAQALNVELWEMFDFEHQVETKDLHDLLKQLSHEIDADQLRLAVKVLRAMVR